ncbi:hypothetical protein NDR87_27730 [Nocardia sp. CDC159]|uniref:Uncharacterized protein n=1 Tax=Nocardia pulmonis TaxID=2951408 RepID=A0A9X2EFI9_9NOCA|nr:MULTISPECIES: hypothetical protein [Nocardia]MCM6777283.1 hypothetical protein [Nocardia pulmonis]MCM6790168.1 hypothetical protein [Nocardia sp. CDC159]
MSLIVVGAVPETLTPMGMNKAGPSQPVDPSGVPVRLTQWTARPEFPGTIISPRAELLPNGSGIVTVHCGVQLAGVWSSVGSLVVDVMKNEEIVVSGQFQSMTNLLELSAPAVSVAPGDRLWVRIGLQALFGGITVTAGANTYLYYDLSRARGRATN